MSNRNHEDLLWRCIGREYVSYTDVKIQFGIGTKSPSAHPKYPWLFAVDITATEVEDEYVVRYEPLSWEVQQVQPKESVMESKQDKCGVHDLAINGGAKCILEPGHQGDHKNIYGTFSMEFKGEVVDETKPAGRTLGEIVRDNPAAAPFILPAQYTQEEIMGAVKQAEEDKKRANQANVQAFKEAVHAVTEDDKRAEKMAKSGGFAYGPTNDSRFTAEMVLQHMISGDFTPLIQECERLGVEVQEMKRFLGMTTKSGDDGAVWVQLSLKKSN